MLTIAILRLCVGRGGWGEREMNVLEILEGLDKLVPCEKGIFYDLVSMLSVHMGRIRPGPSCFGAGLDV